MPSCAAVPSKAEPTFRSVPHLTSKGWLNIRSWISDIRISTLEVWKSYQLGALGPSWDKNFHAVIRGVIYCLTVSQSLP